MRSLFPSSLTRKWNDWNDRLEQLNSTIVSHLTSCLPSCARKTIKNHLTQAQLTIHSLGTSILLQGTFGNLLISPWITYPIGITGILTTSGVTYRFLKKHIAELSETSLMSRISSLTLTTILGVSQCMVFYQIDKSSKLTDTEKCSLGIWTTWVNATLQTFFHSIFISKINHDEEIHLNTDDHKNNYSIRYETEKNCERIKNEILQLKNNIAKVKQFIAERPQLKAICEKYIAEHPEGIVPVRKPDLEGLDRHNIYEYECILGLTKDAHEIELREIMLFIRRHREVHTCFKEHMEQAQEELSIRTGRLLEN